MNANLLRIALGLVILAATAGADPQAPKNKDDAPAERNANPLLEKQAKDLAVQYEQDKRQFTAARERASAALVGRFDTALKQVRNNTRWPADMRRDKVKKITDEKSGFTANGNLPQSDDMLGALLEYQEALYKSYSRVAKSYEQLFNLYSVKLKDESRAEALAAEKEEFDQKIRGQARFAAANWLGIQQGGNNIPFVLNVEGVEGNSIKGRIVQDRYPNETVFKMEGLLSGNRVQLKSTQVLQGRARGLVFTGYVMDNRIVGTVVSVATNGKPSQPNLVRMSKR
jgi:hypothetical protein